MPSTVADPQTTTMTTRRLRPADCQVVAGLHMQCLPGEFLSLLGRNFLATLYDAIHESDDSFIFVVEQQGKVIGFVSGAVQSGRVYRSLIKKKRARFALWAGLAVLRRPRLLGRVVAALRPSFADDQYAAHAELLSIAVAPDSQQSGAGKLLLRTFNAEMRGRGVEFYHLVVDERNTRARSFYERCGFTFIERVRMFGTWKARMGCHLVPHATTSL